jgi:uncharacterized integral membrane protein
MDFGALADICVPLPFVMLLGAVILGLFLGVCVMAVRLENLRRNVARVFGLEHLLEDPRE